VGFSPLQAQVKFREARIEAEEHMPPMIERFGKQHERDGFDCGKPSLNDFLVRLVSQYEKRNLARTYVLVQSGEVKVLGYYTLTSSAIEFETLPAGVTKKLPQHPIPSVLLARLAVDNSMRGQKMGARLLRDCFERCLHLAEQIGIHSVTVDAIDDEAARFYEHFGFTRFAEQPSKLFLPISSIKLALQPTEQVTKPTDSPVYLVYLADVKDDTATFAVFTHYLRQADDRHEVRVPSLVSLEKANTALYTLDRPLPVIANQDQFKAWLASRSGWAAFRPEAAQLVPHWLETTEYACTKFHLGAVEFVESSCFVDLATSDVQFNLAGPLPEDGAFAWFAQITGNLVVSKRPLPGG
jgi:predicted GNAT family N-acyltransferase